MLAMISTHHNTMDFKINIAEGYFIYHKVQFMPLRLMLLTSSIHYKILSLIFSTTQREKQRETANNSKPYRDNQNTKL